MANFNINAAGFAIVAEARWAADVEK